MTQSAGRRPRSARLSVALPPPSRSVNSQSVGSPKRFARRASKPGAAVAATPPDGGTALSSIGSAANTTVRTELPGREGIQHIQSARGQISGEHLGCDAGSRRVPGEKIVDTFSQDKVGNGVGHLGEPPTDGLQQRSSVIGGGTLPKRCGLEGPEVGENVQPVAASVRTLSLSERDTAFATSRALPAEPGRPQPENRHIRVRSSGPSTPPDATHRPGRRPCAGPAPPCRSRAAFSTGQGRRRGYWRRGRPLQWLHGPGMAP